jgi:UDP-N-acetyl-D-glucosamine dehydrogenase
MKPTSAISRIQLRAIAPNLRDGQLVILESTTYPDRTEEVLVPILEKGNNFRSKAAHTGLGDKGAFYVAFSPEREHPGNTKVSRRDVPKVIGGLDPLATQYSCALYKSNFNHVVPVSSPAMTEMTKPLESIYRA